MSPTKDKLCDVDFDKLVIDTSKKVSQKDFSSEDTWSLECARKTDERPPNAEQGERLDDNRKRQVNSNGDSTATTPGCDPSEVALGIKTEHASTVPNSESSEANGSYNRLNRPKRPMNAFMVWGQAIRRELHHRFSNVQNASLSKALGRVWRSLEPEEKEPYVRRASIIKANHKRDYPNYRYQPRRIQEKRSKGSVMLSSSTSSSPATLATSSASLISSRVELASQAITSLPNNQQQATRSFSQNNNGNSHHHQHLQTSYVQLPHAHQAREQQLSLSSQHHHQHVHLQHPNHTASKLARMEPFGEQRISNGSSYFDNLQISIDQQQQQSDSKQQLTTNELQASSMGLPSHQLLTQAELNDGATAASQQQLEATIYRHHHHHHQQQQQQFDYHCHHHQHQSQSSNNCNAPSTNNDNSNSNSNTTSTNGNNDNQESMTIKQETSELTSYSAYQQHRPQFLSYPLHHHHQHHLHQHQNQHERQQHPRIPLVHPHQSAINPHLHPAQHHIYRQQQVSQHLSPAAAFCDLSRSAGPSQLMGIRATDAAANCAQQQEQIHQPHQSHQLHNQHPIGVDMNQFELAYYANTTSTTAANADAEHMFGSAISSMGHQL